MAGGSFHRRWRMFLSLGVSLSRVTVCIEVTITKFDDDAQGFVALHVYDG